MGKLNGVYGGIENGKKTIYFNEPGPQNTEQVISAVEKRLENSDLKYVLVASDSGRTALKAAQAVKNYQIELICVSGYAGIRR